nr:hypothetical protein [Tanacetum cinerariifolium]
PKMKETQAYQTYLGFPTGATPPKKARKFKKPASPKLNLVLVSTEAPTKKSKRVKRPTKKSTKTPARGKSTGDFHKTHPSGSGTVTKTALSVAKIKPSATSEGTSVKPGVLDVVEESSSEREAESWGNDEDDSNNEQVSSDDDSDQEKDSDDDKAQSVNEHESDSEHETDDSESAKGDEDEEMDFTISQLYDDVDIRLNERVDTDEGFVQEVGTDAAMTNIQQGNKNLEILQVIKEAHVTLFIVSQKTEVLVTSYSHSSDLAAKFLNFSDIPHSNAETVSPMDVHVVLAKESSQTQSSYEAAARLQNLRLKKSYDLEKTFFSTYGKVYSLKRSRKDKDKGEDPSVGLDRGLKKRKTSKDAEPTKEEPEFEVADSDMPHDQEETHVIMMNPRKRLHLNVNGSPNLHNLKDSSMSTKVKETGKVPIEMELVLEQTQQGSSYEVSVSAEGIEELKRKVKIKGDKKEALFTLRQKPG